jgi:uroporphyrinogen-III synthase
VIDFIVTKPGAGGAALTRALVDAGGQAWHLPAFELGPAPDPAAARALLAQAAGFDLVIAVSPAAARGAAALMQAPWPAWGWPRRRPCARRFTCRPSAS